MEQEQRENTGQTKRPTPSVSRIVQYRLTEDDLGRISSGLNNTHTVGQVLPAIVVRVYNDNEGWCNLRVFADGESTLWKTSVTPGDAPGQWSWPART